jgi:hypothetical protein
LPAAEKLAVTGPLTSVQATLLIVAPATPEADPVSVRLLVGSWIVCATPALTAGGPGVGAVYVGIVVSPCRNSHCHTFIGCGVPQTWLIFGFDGIVHVVLGSYSVFQQQCAPPP